MLKQKKKKKDIYDMVCFLEMDFISLKVSNSSTYASVKAINFRILGLLRSGCSYF